MTMTMNVWMLVSCFEWNYSAVNSCPYSSPYSASCCRDHWLSIYLLIHLLRAFWQHNDVIFKCCKCFGHYSLDLCFIDWSVFTLMSNLCIPYSCLTCLYCNNSNSRMKFWNFDLLHATNNYIVQLMSAWLYFHSTAIIKQIFKKSAKWIAHIKKYLKIKPFI